MKQDFRNTKIHIKSEAHSKAFQEAVFAAGGEWLRGGQSYQEIQFPLPTKGHVHAELMAQYAEDAKTHAEPWKLWQFNAGSWGDCMYSPAWATHLEYRRKPKTHFVHGVEIPDLRVSPKQSEYYYLAGSYRK